MILFVRRRQTKRRRNIIKVVAQTVFDMIFNPSRFSASWLSDYKNSQSFILHLFFILLLFVSFFRMRFVVARCAQTDKIIIDKRKFRKLVGVFDMMYDHGFAVFAVPLAPLALIMIPLEDHLTLVFPALGFVVEGQRKCCTPLDNITIPLPLYPPTVTTLSPYLSQGLKQYGNAVAFCPFVQKILHTIPPSSLCLLPLDRFS